MSEVTEGILRMPDNLFWSDDPVARFQHNQARHRAADEIRRLQAALTAAREEVERVKAERDAEFRRGVLCASEIADTYNGCTTHQRRLGDCIMAKFNLRDEPTRPNDNPHHEKLVADLARIAELQRELDNANAALPPGGLTRHAYEQRIAELEAVVPATRDGVRVTDIPGGIVWRCESDGIRPIKRIAFWAGRWGTRPKRLSLAEWDVAGVSDCYSTEAAAQAAQRGEGAKPTTHQQSTD